MSIWISDAGLRPFIFGVLLLAGLTACAPARLGRSGPAPTQKTTIQVSSKNLTIQGPPGFCVDNSITEVQADNAFVLLGSCAVVSPTSRAPEPDVRALLTASVSGAGQGQSSIRASVATMDRFFRSEDGRTALSRNSDPGTVQVLDTFHKDGMFFIRASDSSQGLVPGASDDYWRAYFDLNDQIVSVSVIGFKSAPLNPDQGLLTLRQFAQTILTSNGVGPDPLPLAEIEEEEPVQTAASQPPRRKIRPNDTLMNVGILRRIFGS